MGYFEGNYGITVGDEPADLLGSAMEVLWEKFHQQFPEFTKVHFLANLEFVLGPFSNQFQLFLEHVPRHVCIGELCSSEDHNYVYREPFQN